MDCDRVYDHESDQCEGERLAPAWHVWEANRGARPAVLAGRWDDLVGAVDGHVTQTAEWVEYALATGEERAVLIAGLDTEGTPRGVAVGFISAPRWPLRGFKTIRFPAYPGTGRSASALREAVATCERVARARRCMTIEFLGVGCPEAGEVVASLGYSTNERLEYIFDLTRGEQALWNGLKPQHRKNVRRSAREQVSVVRMESPESVRILRALQQEVAQRHAARGDPFGLQPPEVYAMLYRSLIAGGLGRVYCSFVDGTPVSAALFLTFARRAMSVYSGSNQRGLEAYGEYGMYWQALAELSREGFRELQLGVADPEVEDPASKAHGLHEFKMGFGAQARRVPRAEKRLRPTAIRAHQALKRLKAVLGRA